jgi:hypothetical protein
VPPKVRLVISVIPRFPIKTLKITAYYCIIIQNNFTASAKTAIALSTVEKYERPAKLLWQILKK